MQGLLVALEILAVLAQAALLLGATHIPRAKRLEEAKADGERRVIDEEQCVERCSASESFVRVFRCVLDCSQHALTLTAHDARYKKVRVWSCLLY